MHTKFNNKLVLVIVLILILLCLAAVFIYQYFNVRKQTTPQYQPVTVNQLKTFIAQFPLPPKSPGIKRITQKLDGFSVDAASVGNIDSPVSFNINDGKIAFTSIANQNLGGLNTGNMQNNNGKITFNNLYNGINLIYTASKQGILEEYEIHAKRQMSYILQKIDLTGLTYKVQADGSIIFTNSDDKFAFAIPRPVMYEKYNTKNRNFGLHYEIFDFQGNKYLAKVIDASGQEWLAKSHYPVMIDATILLTLFSYTSYPTIDGSWQIGIQTVGTGDLLVAPAVGTTWDFTASGSADLNSPLLTCDGTAVPYQASESAIIFPNFSCDGNIVVNTKVNNIEKQNSLDFTYSGFTTTVESLVDTGKPIIVSSFVNPPVVKIGDTITINAEVADNTSGVQSVTADIGGLDNVTLSLISGDNKDGVWQATWTVNGTHANIYEILINASNVNGGTTKSSIGFFDPVDCSTGGNFAGADLDPATYCNAGSIAGSFTNIGTLHVDNGETATIKTFDGVSNYGIATFSASVATIAGTLTANNTGWAGGTLTNNGKGPGRGIAPSGTGGPGGAGYGGVGGFGGSGTGIGPGGNAYGSLSTPGDLGSGGASSGGAGAGGAGGGSIKITTSGSLTVSGTISANGQNAPSSNGGGGSGGSIYLLATNFAGSGNITATGGNYNGGAGGGGGGRIAIYYTNANTFNGTTSVSAGTYNGTTPSVDGTAFIQSLSSGDLIIPSNNGNWRQTDLTSWQFRNLTINGNVTLQSYNATLLTLTATGSTTLATGITITASGSSSTSFNGTGVYLNLTGDVTIPATTTISANGTGYVGAVGSKNGDGPGHGWYSPGTGGPGGGSYGGLGGTGSNGTSIGQPGPLYGSLNAPVDLGSGGASNGAGNGGAGGGAIRLATTGTLTINGNISANGINAPNSTGAGGSGGSIYLMATNLAGSGNISATGGNNNGGGGGGGGGRIAAYYTVANSFNGTTNVTAGSNGGTTSSVDGTAFIKSQGSSDLIISSNNGYWRNTDLTNWQFHNLTVNGNITLQSFNAALLTLTATGSTLFSNGITITASGSSTTDFNGTGVYLNLSGDVSIPTNTVITANGTGYLGGVSGSANGKGPGGGAPSTGGGGYGGNGATSGGSGGSTYGSSTAPIDLGSGGGQGGAGIAGAGGGAIEITTTGTLNIFGTISANGQSGISSAGAGGSGGSIYLIAPSIGGSGTITANGGTFAGGGGGGGGGRVALYCTAGGNWRGNTLNPANAAVLGAGGAGGSNGTVYNSGCLPNSSQINGNLQINGNVEFR